MDETRLPIEAFRVLAAIAWADDRIDPQEIEAIGRAARAEGYADAELASVDAALAHRTSLADTDVESLSARQRLYLYAMATWVATLSFGINEPERSFLDQLREKMELTTQETEALDEALCDLLLKPHGMRPERFDFAGLRQAVADKVEAVEAWTPVKGTPTLKP
jgi:hypothetical protein